MHAIKGMVGCLGDMGTVMIKLHEKEPNTCKSLRLVVVVQEEVECGDTGWPGKKREESKTL